VKKPFCVNFENYRYVCFALLPSSNYGPNSVFRFVWIECSEDGWLFILIYLLWFSSLFGNWDDGKLESIFLPFKAVYGTMTFCLCHLSLLLLFVLFLFMRISGLLSSSPSRKSQDSTCLEVTLFSTTLREFYLKTGSGFSTSEKCAARIHIAE